MNTSDIEVFSMFKNLPDGSIKAYTYHNRLKLSNEVSTGFAAIMLLLSIYGWYIAVFNSRTLAAITSLLSIVFWNWLVKNAMKNRRKHIRSLNEILDGMHKKCYGGCYSLLDGKHYGRTYY